MFGQRIDYLTSCTDWGKEIPQIKLYIKGLNKILLDNFSEKPLARYVVRPSFDPEYCFQIEQLEGNSYILKVTYLRTNYWYLKNRDTINPVRVEKKISSEFAQNIGTLFEKALDSVDHRPGIIEGIDGVEYFLYKYSENRKISCGRTWSPSKGSKMYELIDICDRIVNYAKSEDNSLENIQTQIKILIYKF
jgi:hypothetical protein